MNNANKFNVNEESATAPRKKITKEIKRSLPLNLISGVSALIEFIEIEILQMKRTSIEKTK